jgi:DNA-binding CsgD family transcriptional regulator
VIRREDRAAIHALADRQRGREAARVIARWLDDDRATFDVLRDPEGKVCGYLCSIELDAATEPPTGDPVIERCVAYLRAIDWFGPATPPDACAVVFRDWTVAGSQTPRAGAALVLAQMASRLVTTPAVELQFVVTDRPEIWERLIRFLGLAPHTLAGPRCGAEHIAVIAADCRGVAIAPPLHEAGGPAPALAAIPARATLTSAAALPVQAFAVDRTPVLAVGTGPVPLAVAGASARTSPTDEARELSVVLERRVAQLARSAALSPREQEVLQLLVLGRNYVEIGTALHITPRTARFHQHNVLEKIGAESRLDIVRLLL